MEDVGAPLGRGVLRDPFGFLDLWFRGSWRLRTPFNDIRPWNMGKNGLIFDPVKHPIHEGLEAIMAETAVKWIQIEGKHYIIEQNGTLTPAVVIPGKK